MKASRFITLLSVLLLALCLCAPRAAAAGPTGPVLVSDARGLLESIASDTTVVLSPGRYDVSAAIGEIMSGDSAAWLSAHPGLRFEDCWDGYALLISGVDGLTIRGMEQVELVVEPRQADVLRFENCRNITLETMTLGHSERPGVCMGDVLDFSACEGVTLRGLDLYGCGAFGVTAMNCGDLRMEDSTIRDCSYGLLNVSNSRGLRFINCSMHGTGGYNMLDVTLSSLSFDGCTFEDNSGLWGFLSQAEGNSLRFYACSFGAWETAQLAAFREGNSAVSFDELCQFSDETDKGSVSVSSVGELFEAVRPGAAIFLEPGRYNLSEWIDETWAAEGEAWNGRHPFVRLEECFDGVQAVITGADGMSIMGLGEDRSGVELVIEPRYARVLRFENCYGLSVANLTAGHTEGAECGGSVLDFDSCSDITLTNLDLYGCGTYGVSCTQCGPLAMRGCRVHDCVYGPLDLYGGWGDYAFEDCVFSGSAGGFSAIESPDLHFRRCIFGADEYASIAFRAGVTLEHCSW